MRSKVGFYQASQRGRSFWLRRFLGAAILGMFGLAGAGSMNAQIQIPGPEHLTHVEGLVVNSSGHPAVDVEITLVRNDAVIYRTRTDRSGAFRFEHASGPYTFRVARSADAPAAREIVVTDEIVTRVERKKLYVILGPGACADECSSVLTSRHAFEQAIREKNRR